MNDESELIDRARQGDTSAFGQLVRTYQDRLFTSVFHVVQQHEEAEDIVQDAFVQALLKLQTFRGKSSFYTWLYRIAFNAAVNRRRRQDRGLSIEHGFEAAGRELPDQGDPPEERLVRQERARQIQLALGQLSEEFRAVLVLREVEGFDYQTIARVLNVSVGTVRSRLHRARALMRQHLGRKDQDPTSSSLERP